jgi:hypothetical protein
VVACVMKCVMRWVVRWVGAVGPRGDVVFAHLMDEPTTRCLHLPFLFLGSQHAGSMARAMEHTAVLQMFSC